MSGATERDWEMARAANQRWPGDTFTGEHLENLLAQARLEGARAMQAAVIATVTKEMTLQRGDKHDAMQWIGIEVRAISPEQVAALRDDAGER